MARAVGRCASARAAAARALESRAGARRHTRTHTVLHWLRVYLVLTWHGRVTQARGCWWPRELQRWLERWAGAPAHVPPRRERSSRALALAGTRTHTVLHWLRVYLALCHVARPCHSGARLLRSASATVDVAPRREHSKCTLMLAGTRVRTLRNHPGYHGTGVPCARTCLGAVSLRGPPAGGVGPRDSISLLR